MELVFLPTIIFVSSFILYLVSRQDFVLLRKNISVSWIFDSAVIAFVIALFFSRFLYALNNQDLSLFHVIKFFHLIKFPGLSILGFFLGGALALYIIYRKSNALARIYDIFTISFMQLYVFDTVVRAFSIGPFYVPLIFLVLFIFIFLFFIRSHYRYTLKDGTMSLAFLLLVAITSFIFQFFDPGRHIVIAPFSIAQITSVFLIFATLILIFINQKFLKF